MAVVVTRRETFTAGHRLFNPSFSDERNLAVFGKCSSPSGHGHNYVMEVSVAGDLDPETGYVMDLGTLSAVLHEAVIADVDHRNLNTDVDWLAGRIPTTEVLADAIWDRLEQRLPAGRLWRVRIRETEKNWAERRRDPS
ncbi:MAG TPA: 6-carboxytetrahydropterin synthase [Actinomycetota bacterium]